MFKYLIIAYLIVGSISLNAQSVNHFKISTGITYSNVTSQQPANEDINPFRYGFWVSASHNWTIKKLFSIDFGLTYQERMPLEFFDFSGTPNSNTGTFMILRDYPSNPQHEFFRVGDFTYFPNFKYLHVEAIPSINFGKKITTSIGLGLFGGILLNKNQTTKTSKDFPDLEAGFQQLNINGIVEYTRFDLGIIPKITSLYNITNKIAIGIELKSYHSLVRVNDSFIQSERVFNFFWIAYSSGFCVQYEF